MPVGRVIFQKIAYVATALGLPTGLTHMRGSFGPYCRELDEVKKRLANAGLIQEEKSGSMFRVFPGLAYEKEVAAVVRNLGILKWFQLKPSTDLPVDEI